MEEKIHMETAEEAFIRLSPLRNHDGLRKFLVQETGGFCHTPMVPVPLAVTFYQEAAISARTRRSPASARSA